MAYNGLYLSNAIYLGGKAGRKLFFYTTTDAAGTIDDTGYFSDGVERGMEVGDVVIVTVVTTLPFTTPLGISLYVVSAATATACTVIKTATA